ncbi:conserved hypothetical protein [Ricinus communis]|uniref:Uncharacterized protein n=1 Tax=Ricinus communis TaxID=3988 RepID=B9R8K8_RICCO|nr:conserved hypothetical protein [Ricinus communis]
MAATASPHSPSNRTPAKSACLKGNRNPGRRHHQQSHRLNAKNKNVVCTHTVLR